MRAAGIIRIIVGLVIAVLLTAILVVLLTGNNIFSNLGWDGGWIGRIVDRATYTSGGMDLDSDEVIVSDQASVPASSISKIKISWVAGSVNLRVGSGEDIVFSEASYRTLTDRQKMRYTVTDSGELRIEFCEDLENIFDWFSLDANMPAKTLTLEVPASLIGLLTDVNVETVSAEIDLSGVYGTKTDLSTVSGGIRCADILTDELELDSTSGGIVCENCTSDMLKLNNVSGSMRVEGEYNKVKADTVSGSMMISSAKQPESIDVDGVSGSVTIALPEGSNFTARLDSVSGSVSCEFPGTIGDDMVVVGSGGAVYHINTVSGSLKIEKN
jgi:lia operon protein LiaG